MELFVYLPLVQEVTERHEPNFHLRPSQQRHTVKDQPGKQLFIAYPAVVFFEPLPSLWISRLVPLYMAFMMAVR